MLIKKLCLIFFTIPLLATSFSEVEEHFKKDSYLIRGESECEDVMICLHGFGMDETISYFVNETKMAPYHLISFNFPDWGDEIDVSKTDALSFGTINELKPAIKRLYRAYFEMGAERLHLYGFSAGGGAAVNLLATLKSHRFESELGINGDEMDQIYAAIERGSVILDCPLKSLDEIWEGSELTSPEFYAMAQKYIANDMRPIDSLLKLKGSKLRILLALQDPDDVLTNRDDQLFIDRLKEANSAGITHVSIGRMGLHMPAMPTLVEAYQKMMRE